MSNFWKYLILVVILFPSCEFEPPGLTIQERKIADSLFRDSIKIYGKQLDTLCLQLQDSLIPIYRDSMLEMREKEIQKQLERVKIIAE